MNSEDQTTLSTRLTFALAEKGVTQTELARKIGIKKQTIQYLCASGTNRSKFSYDIAHALDINVDWLITGTGAMNFCHTKDDKLLLDKSKTSRVSARVKISSGKWLSASTNCRCFAPCNWPLRSCERVFKINNPF